MITFEKWLHSRNLDAQSWHPELRAALRAQYDAQKPKQPPSEKLVAAGRCQWPARVYRQPI